MEEKGITYKSVPIISANLIASNNNNVDNLKIAGSGFEMDFYVCKVCGLSLTSSDALNNHLRSFHIKKRGKDCFPCGCPPCEEIFQTSALLINHLRREHTEQILSSCGRCGKKLTSFYSVPTHHSSHPPSKLYCNVCVTELKNAKDDVEKVGVTELKNAKDNVENVVKMKNNEENTSKSVSNVSLNISPGNNSNIDESKRTECEGEMDAYICKICHLGFSLSDALDDHLYSLHVITRFSCGSCKEEFKTLEMLMNHLRRDHTEQKVNFCSQCGQKFTCSVSIPINCGSTDPPKIYCSQCAKERENENSQVVKVILEKNFEENSSDSIFDDTTNLSPCDTDVDGFHCASSDDETDSYFCQICQHSLSSSDALDDHLRSLHVVKSARGYFSCCSCIKLFKTLVMLINHLRRDHTVQKIHSCGQCRKKLTVSHSVPTHDRGKGPSQIYCGLCIMEPENAKKKTVEISEEKNCRQDGDILENAVQVLELTAEDYSACHLIDKKDNTVTSSNNRNIKRKEKKFACDICSKKFWKRATLLNHKRKHCSENPNSSEEKHCGQDQEEKTITSSNNRSIKRKEKNFACDTCSKKFWKRATLLNHKRKHCSENPNSSEEKHCGQNQKDETITSSNNRSIKRRERKFACDTCSKKFWSEASLLIHLRNNCQETPYPCEVCDKTFSSLHNLGRHLQSHSGERPYLCETCGKKFTRKELLQNHQVLHTGERPHVCDICGKGFITKVRMQQHRFVHTGEGPYSCEFCGKKFSTSTCLAIHRRTHSGERPYVCEACGKGFAQKTHLKIHLLVHTGEKPYECDICRRTFTYKYVLVAHRRIHTGERPFQCDFCRKGFVDKGQLKKHQRTHH